MHKASCSQEELWYCFFQGHPSNLGNTSWKINYLNPVWIRFLARSQLSNPSDLPCYICACIKYIQAPVKICPSQRNDLTKYYNIFEWYYQLSFIYLIFSVRCPWILKIIFICIIHCLASLWSIVMINIIIELELCIVCDHIFRHEFKCPKHSCSFECLRNPLYLVIPHNKTYLGQD